VSNCDKYLELISNYIDNGIIDTELEAHLNICSSCRDELLDIQNLVHELGALPELLLPDGFHERTMENVKKQKKVRSLPRINAAQYTSIAAAVVCFFLLGGVLTLITQGLGERDLGLDYGVVAAQGGERQPFMAPMPTAVPIDMSPEELALPIGARIHEDTSQRPPREDVYIAGGMGLPDLAMPSAVTQRDVADEPERVFHPVVVHSNHTEIISRNYSISLTVQDMDTAVRILRTAGHEIESSHISPYSSFISLNVPAHEFENAKNLARSLGENAFEWESTTDLTHATNDWAIRYNARLEESRRLAALISQAESADDIILLQSRISQIEHDRAHFRGLYNQNLIQSRNFSVGIDLFPEGVPHTHFEPAFGERISTAFTGSVNFTTIVFEGLLVGISTAIIPLTLIAVIGAAVYFSYKKYKKPIDVIDDRGQDYEEDL